MEPRLKTLQALPIASGESFSYYESTMNVTEVKDLDHPDLHPYRTLRRPLDHHRQGIFVAEGEKVVRRLLESSLQVVSVLLTPEWFSRYETGLMSHRSRPEIYVAQKQVVESIVGFHLHQGIMAVGKVPAPIDLFALLPGLRKPYLLVAVDGLTNSENLGVLVRNCAAFGVQALIAGETSSSPYLRRSVRNSMGTVFHLPVVHSDNLSRTLHDLSQRHGIRTIAAHPHSRESLRHTDLTADCCVVFGSEGEGISKPILEACTHRIAIPTPPEVDSLNVASASAVVLYEVRRQREE